MNQRSLLLGQRILVVNDDIDTLFLLTFTLEKCGAKVAAALSTSEAIEVFKQFHPTLLISDIGLPFEDGFSLIQELRTLEAGLGWQVPAIALTGYAGKEWQEQSLELGFQQYIMKPILLDVLIEIVIQLLGQSE
ncbi:response regulator [Trichocoleus desertorum AS-A10]|uniref:response regulator n=1 Tax=Trichocoleus desertorum TaxID=1481672 RepID=UPI0032992E84